MQQTAVEPIKSVNHRAFDDQIEYLIIENNLYTAEIAENPDETGNRPHKWLCTVEKALEYPESFPFLQPKSWNDRLLEADSVGTRGSKTTLFQSSAGHYVSID